MKAWISSGSTVAALGFALVPAPLLAQETAAQDEQELERITVCCGQEIIVTGGALPYGPSPARQVVLDADRLRNAASGRVEDSLRDIAGLQQFRRSDARSAHPTSQGMTMRGLGGNAASRTVVTFDGVPVTDPFGGWVNWPSVNAQRLGAIRVTRGGASLSNGPGGVAGTIELFSENRPSDYPEWGGGIAYGSRNGVSVDAMASGSEGDSAFVVAGQFERSDGFVPSVKGQRGLADKRAPYAQGSIALRGTTALTDHIDMQAMISGFHDERNRGTDYSDSRSTGADASVRIIDDSGRTPWSVMLYGQLRQMSSGFASVSADRNVASATLDQYRVPSTGWGGAAEIRPLHGLRLGIDGRAMTGESRERYSYVAGAPTRLRRAGGASGTVGSFATLNKQLLGGGSILGSVSAGVRLDRWWLKNGALAESEMAGAALTDARYPVRTGWEPSASLGLDFNIGGGFGVRGAGYTNWRLPTLNELYRPYRVGADAIAANPALDPERVKGVELGVGFKRSPTLNVGATVFLNRLDKAIANVTLANGPGVFPGVGFVSAAGQYKQRRNLDAIVSKGIEVDAQLEVRRNWHLAAAYAYTDARVRGSGDSAGLDRLRPAQVAKYSGSVRLAYDSDGLDGAVTVRAMSAQFEDDQNMIRLKPAVTLDATLAMPISERFRVELRGENLGNRVVEATRSRTGLVERALPRTIWLGLRYAVE